MVEKVGARAAPRASLRSSRLSCSSKSFTRRACWKLQSDELPRDSARGRKKNAKRTKRGARRRNRLREQTVQTESRQRSALIGFDTTLKRQVALEICPTNAQAQRVTARGRCHGIRGLEEYRVSSRTFIKPLIQGLINCIKNHFNI